MSEAGDDEAKYKIRWEADGKWTNSSRDRSGKASAEYFNGDKYEGEYVNGVRTLSWLLYLNSSNSKGMVRVTILGRMVLSTPVTMLRTRSMDLVRPPIRNSVAISVSPH